ncbi:MAG: hypothetical protein H6719_35455 [Sandaracinaceae bacterium]|nr:hypothetical protein [Sandaracinaceae bacterium]
MVGHSFGAQAIGLMDELGDVDGFVSVAGQLGWYGHWPLPTQLELGLLWHLVIPRRRRARSAVTRARRASAASTCPPAWRASGRAGAGAGTTTSTTSRRRASASAASTDRC